MVDSQYFFQNELDKAYFQDIWLMKNLKIYLLRTASDTVFLDKAFNIAKSKTWWMSTWICFNSL